MRGTLCSQKAGVKRQPAASQLQPNACWFSRVGPVGSKSYTNPKQAHCPPHTHLNQPETCPRERLVVGFRPPAQSRSTNWAWIGSPVWLESWHPKNQVMGARDRGNRTRHSLLRPEARERERARAKASPATRLGRKTSKGARRNSNLRSKLITLQDMSQVYMARFRRFQSRCGGSFFFFSAGPGEEFVDSACSEVLSDSDLGPAIALGKENSRALQPGCLDCFTDTALSRKEVF